MEQDKTNDDVDMEEDEDNAPESESIPPKIPVTIITGFLGSGKSTLLNQLLKNTRSANQSLTFAVIENELGNVSIDDQLLKLDKQFHTPQDEEILQVTNVSQKRKKKTGWFGALLLIYSLTHA